MVDQGEVEETDREALLVWLAEELGVGNVQTYLASAYAGLSNTDLRPYKAAAKLHNYATVLKDTEGGYVASLKQVVGEVVVTTDPPSEAQIATIVTALGKPVEEGGHYAAAGEWIAAMGEYIGVLNSQIGWSPERSIGFVMEKYGSKLTADGELRTAMFVQMYLEGAYGG
jgi:hypothetical protein